MLYASHCLHTNAKVDTSCILSHIGSPRWVDDLVPLWEYRRKVTFPRTESL